MAVFSPRTFWLPVMLATLVAAFFGALLGRRGRELEHLLRERDRLASENAELERENARLRALRNALLTSPSAIERVAREDYGFAAPGERVEEFDPSTVPEPGAAAPAPPRPRWLQALCWQHFPVALPAAVFALTAVILMVWNAAASARSSPG